METVKQARSRWPLHCRPGVTLLLCLMIFHSAAESQIDNQKVAELVFKAGEKFERLRNWPEALDYFSKAVKLNATKAYRYKAAYAATKCQPPRWKVAEDMLRHNRRHLESTLLNAEIQWRQGGWQKARGFLEKAADNAPDDPRIHFAWGNFAYLLWQEKQQNGDKTVAVNHYQRCLSQSPNFRYRPEIKRRLRVLQHGEAGHRLNEAIDLLAEGREFKRVENYLNDAENFDPDWIEPAYWRGMLCNHSKAVGYYDETGEQSEAHWQRAESLPEARLELARLYLRRGNLEEALEEAEAARDLEPKWVSSLLLLSEIYQELKQYGRAREYFAKVTEYAPDSPEAEHAKHELQIRPSIPPESPLDWKPNIEKFLEEYGPEIQDDPKTVRRLQKIAHRLHKAADISGVPPRVRLLANASENAWAIPPNYLFITKGLVEFANRVEVVAEESKPDRKLTANDVLAFVLGHEWTHLRQHDYERNREFEDWPGLRQGLGRFAEINADREGLLLSSRAEYNPYAAIEWFQTTVDEQGDWDALGDHPSLWERQQRLVHFLSGEVRHAHQSFDDSVKAFEAYKDALKAKDLKGVTQSLEAATRAFEAYQRLFPNDGAVLENLSILYFLRGVSVLPHHPWKPYQLEHDIQLEPQLDPSSPRMSVLLEEAHRWWDKAYHQAAILLRLQPNRPAAYQVLGDIALAKGKEEYEFAEEMYQKGLSIDPHHRGLLNNFGVLHALRDHDQLESARQLWRRIPNSEAAQQNLRVK